MIADFIVDHIVNLWRVIFKAAATVFKQPEAAKVAAILELQAERG